MDKHVDRAHALLSASTAERWLNCTKAPRLEEAFGVKRTSKYADEGTLAHELAEKQLKRHLGLITEDEFFVEILDIVSNELYTEDMMEEVQKYVDFVLDEYAEAQEISSDAIIDVEVKLDLEDYIEEGFGTSDSVILSDRILRVIDLKFGKGLRVSAIENKQGMLYALGVYKKYQLLFDIDVVKIIIHQPRLDHVSQWEIAPDELLAWGEEEVIPKAKIAFKGEGELNPGSWCKFCSVSARCKGLTASNLAFEKYNKKSPDLLSDDEVAEVIVRSHQLAEWANSVRRYASETALTTGKKWPGFKLVEGSSRRAWAVPEQKIVEVVTSVIPAVVKDDLYDRKLKTLTAVEKLVGKKTFAEKLKDLVMRKKGTIELVDESDKRPEYNSLQSAIDDFSD